MVDTIPNVDPQTIQSEIAKAKDLIFGIQVEEGELVKNTIEDFEPHLNDWKEYKGESVVQEKFADAEGKSSYKEVKAFMEWDLNSEPVPELHLRNFLHVDYLRQVYEKIRSLLDEADEKMRDTYAWSKLVAFEAERRALAAARKENPGFDAPNMAQRIMFGELPPKDKGHDGSEKDSRRWIARVSSGKTVWVAGLGFGIPEVYRDWLESDIRKVTGGSYIYMREPKDMCAGKKGSIFLYNLGFKLHPTARAYYTRREHTYNNYGGSGKSQTSVYFENKRQVPLTALTPL